MSATPSGPANTSDTTPAPSLSSEEIERFADCGFLGPYTLCEEAEMAAWRSEIEAVLATPSPQSHNTLYDRPENPGHNRHQDAPILHRIATDPAILGRMASIVGPDLQLWRTHFFTKEPGGKEIPWHQDWNYWPLDPMQVVSVWIAIDPVDAANSAPRFIPGSHKQQVPHISAPERMQFNQMADPAHFDATKAQQMVMRPGQFVLFNERTLHQSDPNTSDRRRMGLAVRVIPPTTKVTTYDTDGHGVVQVAGKDTTGINRLVQPPL